MRKTKLDCINLKITKEPYNLSLDVEQAFLGSEAGVSSTLISLALFLQEHIEVCDLSSQKLSRRKSKSQEHFNSNILPIKIFFNPPLVFLTSKS